MRNFCAGMATAIALTIYGYWSVPLYGAIVALLQGTHP